MYNDEGGRDLFKRPVIVLYACSVISFYGQSPNTLHINFPQWKSVLCCCKSHDLLRAYRHIQAELLHIPLILLSNTVLVKARALMLSTIFNYSVLFIVSIYNSVTTIDVTTM